MSRGASVNLRASRTALKSCSSRGSSSVPERTRTRFLSVMNNTIPMLGPGNSKELADLSAIRANARRANPQGGEEQVKTEQGTEGPVLARIRAGPNTPPTHKPPSPGELFPSCRPDLWQRWM